LESIKRPLLNGKALIYDELKRPQLEHLHNSTEYHKIKKKLKHFSSSLFQVNEKIVIEKLTVKIKNFWESLFGSQRQYDEDLLCTGV